MWRYVHLSCACEASCSTLSSFTWDTGLATAQFPADFIGACMWAVLTK